MTIGDIFTLTREERFASTGYCTRLAGLEGFALLSMDIEPPASGHYGAPAALHFTFQAVKAGKAKIQFARFRSWLLPEITLEPELTYQIEEKVEVKAGGWTGFVKPEKNVLDMFQKVATFIGSGYTPLLVSSQVTAGANYIFAANGRVTSLGAVDFPALVHISTGTDGTARVTGIKTLGHAGALGGYTPFRPVEDGDKALIKEASQHWVGGGFEVQYVSTQVVSGVNARFAGTETLSDEKATKLPVLVTVYAPLGGEPHIISIERVYDLI